MCEEHLEIDHLRSAVTHEKKFRDTLEEYCNELELAIAEHDEQRQKSDEQNSEWKTRYEIQQEMNEQLRKQGAVLQAKVASVTARSQAFQKSSRASSFPSEFGAEVTDDTLGALEAEKRALTNQLLNIELRIDQEAKAYHKANEERKAVQLEVGATNAQLSALRLTPAGLAASADPTSHESMRGNGGSAVLKNIRPNQRVIDPKKGPIKRTAAVKQLPPLS